MTQNQITNEGYNLNTIQKKAAYNEMQKYSNYKSDFLQQMIICAVVIVGGIWLGSKLVIGLGTFSIICFIISYFSRRSRMNQLEQILDNKRRIAICPHCKSPNIKSHFVRSSSVRHTTRGYRSKNLNPFMPFVTSRFTVKPTATTYNHTTKYQCNNCGSVFYQPEIFEEEIN